MRVTYGITTLPAVLVLALAGCASSGPVDDPGQASDEAALNVQGETYFAIAADLRKCASPVCGGWFLERLNRTTTTCHDGTRAGACYTPALDWSNVNLSAATQGKLLDACRRPLSEGVYAIVAGRFARTNHTTPRPELGRFVITEAWLAAGDTPSAGAFVRVWDNGLRCFAAPCPSITEDLLNGPQSVDIAAIDWTPAALTERQVATCVAAMATPGGMFIAGDRYTEVVNGTTALGRTSTAAYLRLTD